VSQAQSEERRYGSTGGAEVEESDGMSATVLTITGKPPGPLPTDGGSSTPDNQSLTGEELPNVSTYVYFLSSRPGMREKRSRLEHVITQLCKSIAPEYHNPTELPDAASVVQVIWLTKSIRGRPQNVSQAAKDYNYTLADYIIRQLKLSRREQYLVVSSKGLISLYQSNNLDASTMVKAMPLSKMSRERIDIYLADLMERSKKPVEASAEWMPWMLDIVDSGEGFVRDLIGLDDSNDWLTADGCTFGQP
jgi:hypothetical protein